MKKNNGSKLKIIPLGGLEQIGMNITVFEYEDSIIVVDCGIAFPEDDMLGIDLVIPDVTYLKENIDKVKGFVITHGHEDHIGALPYILKEVNVPVYATKLTIGLIENKLKEHNLLRTTKRKIIKHGQSINLGAFRIEFIKTNHSIADAAALAIYSPAGIIVHTGAIMVDGLGVGDVGNIVLRDRQHLSEDGIMVVVLTLEKRTNQLLAGPDIVSRGFVYVRESEDLMGEAREVVEEALDGCLSKNISDWGKIKSTIKDALGDYVWKKTKRRPMILPIIMEA